MSIRVDTASLIVGALVVGVSGLGVLGSAVPGTGDAGASILYNDLVLPADAGKEVRALITSAPSSGTLFVHEDGALEYTGASTTFLYQLYVDGVAVGAPQTVTFNLGGAEVKVWTGSASIAAEPKAYVGGGWVPVTIKVWNGGAWV